MTAIRALDIFAGAGGLSLGLETAGFEIVGGVDIDPDACETFAKAHPASEVVCGTDGNGHVAVSVGNGQEIGTYGDANNVHPIKQYAVTAITSPPYLGWAFPFGS